MAQIIPFNLPVPESVKDYLKDVSLPTGCQIGQPIWRTDAWGTHRNMPETFNFLKFGLKPKAELQKYEYLPEPWFSTCQVLVIWLRRNKNLSASRITSILSAVKGFLNYVSSENGLCHTPEKLKGKHFAVYEDFLRTRIKNESLTLSGARSATQGLEKFVLFINHFQFTSEKIIYKQSFPRPTSSYEYKIITKDSEGKSTENQIIHKTKLLELDVVFALGNLFNECEDKVDKFFLATALFLSVTGFRVSELLSLKEDCYYEYKHGDDLLVEIRYIAEKGGFSHAKQIPRSAVPFVKDCMKIILDFTEGGRALAKRIEKERTVIPTNCELRNLPRIKLSEIASYLDVDNSKLVKITKKGGLKPVEFPNYYSTSQLISVLDKFYLTPCSARTINYEETVRKLKDGSSIKLSEALFVTKTFEASSRKTISFIPKNLSVETFDNWLDSICSKYNIKNSSGEIIQINSHQFRHLLNTMYVKGGLTDEEIARIFGRKDLKQNRTYNQLSPREKKLQICQDIREQKSIGVITDTYHQIKLVSIEQAEEFLESVIEAVHITEFGLCVLDWARQPCPHHMTCLTGRDGIACRNLVIIKGDKDSLVQIQKHYKIQLRSLERAQESNSPFSQDWINQTVAKIKNMKVIIQIHVDAITQGTTGEAAFPFPDGSTPESITRTLDLAEMNRFEKGK